MLFSRKWAAVLAAFALICRAAEAQSLHVGSLAPPLPPLEYLKGQPLREFEPGRTYVVEFWATWCPPCRMSIPHLTELQRKYPAVRMIGVSAWDRKRDDVTRFVQGMGEKMAYAVAYDANRTTDRLYMTPAGKSGIPCAFIVGADGRLAWMGHPMEMAGPLARVVEGSTGRRGAGAVSARTRMRFLTPPRGRVSGKVTLRVSADPVPRSGATVTVLKVDSREAATLSTVPGEFVWDASQAATGPHKLELLRRDRASGREFVTDTLFLTVGTGALSPATAPNSLTGDDQLSPSCRAVWDATNANRARSGLAGLPENPLLSQAAQRYAEEMAKSGRFAHTGADGSGPSDRARRAGYGSGCSENIAVGQRDAVGVMKSWMTSPGHRRNILDARHTEIGLGYARGKSPGGRNGAAYWVQLFGTGRARLASAPGTPAQLPPSGGDAEVFADFENGYAGWTLGGTCWTKEPATDALFIGQISGFGGRGFACTLHPRKGTDAMGRALSREFTIMKPCIRFLIGGGNHPGQTCLNLRVDGQIVATATGDDAPTLTRKEWNVTALKGKKARLEIVDSTAVPNRGYVLVDDIVFSDPPTPEGSPVAETSLPPLPPPNEPETLAPETTIPRVSGPIPALTFPVLGGARWSDTFGQQRPDHIHIGEDLMASKMRPLVACFSGTVYVSLRGVPGNTITVRSEDGWSGVYRHVNCDTPGTRDGQGGARYAFAAGLKSGDRVRAGQLLGYTGDSGNARGGPAHCHFELCQPSGGAVNPAHALRAATILHAARPALSASR